MRPCILNTLYAMLVILSNAFLPITPECNGVFEAFRALMPHAAWHSPAQSRRPSREVSLIVSKESLTGNNVRLVVYNLIITFMKRR